MMIRALSMVTCAVVGVSATCGAPTVPVWDVIPPVSIDVGGSASIDLDDYVNDGDGSDALLTMVLYGGSASTIRGTLDAASHVVTFTGAPGYSGSVVFQAEAIDPDGNGATVSIDVSAGGGTPGEVPRRVCTTAFEYTGSASSVAVAGQWNNWSTSASPLTDPDGDGTFTGALTIPAGRWQYKLVLNGATWILDPENPYQAWDGGFINSMVKVPDCTLPAVEVDALGVAAGRLKGTFQYLLGSGQASMPSAGALEVTVAGQAVAVDLDASTGVGTIDVPALSPGKYTVRITPYTSGGGAGETLTRPLWVDAGGFDWRDAVLYFAMTDRFSNGVTTNDQPASGVATTANYQGGDWQGLTQKIEEGYFDDLGVDALWISPIRDNPQHGEVGSDGRQYAGYHGYWPKANTVEEHFGGAAALTDLVEAAHAHGIRIMLDLVANHVHDEHPWWASNPAWFNDYDWCMDGGSWDTNPVGCWFMDYLPDLDYTQADPLYAMLDASMALMTTYDLDAIRLDAVKHMDKVFERDLVATVEDTLELDGAQVYFVGETFVGTWDASGYNQGLIAEHIGPGLLDGQFDFPLYWEIVETFARDEQGMDGLDQMMRQADGYYGEDALMSNFLGNHDVPRFISHANGNIADKWGNGAQEQGWTNPPPQPTSAAPYEKLRLAFTFLMTMPGVPLIYYGDEVGLAGAGDPDNRRFMPWTGLNGEQTATRTHVATLSGIRHDHPALSRGDRVSLLADATALAFGRLSAGDKAVVVINKATTSRTLTVPLTGMALTNGTTLTNALGGGTATVSGGSLTVTLGARQSAIYVTP